jgi:uncharacterized protein YlxP (DUF503 family)
MLVAACQIELFLPESASLKQKRFVIQSLKTRIRQKFNYSVAEVGENDKWQKTILGLSMVANERKILERVFEKVLDLVESDGRALIVNTVFEIY